MYCPFCNHSETKVIDSRLADDGGQVRRRRECLDCSERFTTFEKVELALPRVIKSTGEREVFNEAKLRTGLQRALEKRPVDAEHIESAIDQILRKARASGEREMPSRTLGEWMMDALKEMDQVAYVRFASVYRSFQDVNAFREVIERLETTTQIAGGKN